MRAAQLGISVMFEYACHVCVYLYGPVYVYDCLSVWLFRECSGNGTEKESRRDEGRDRDRERERGIE